MWNHDLSDLDFLNSSQSASTLANPHMDSQTEPWMALSLDLVHPHLISYSSYFHLTT